MSTSTLDIYRSHATSLIESEPERWLGSIVWYMIAGIDDVGATGKHTSPVRVTREQMATWFAELGLEEQFLPPNVKKVDAFRRSSSEIKDSYPLPEEGCTAQLRVIEIEHNPEFVLRHVMRDVINSRTEVTTTAAVAAIKFFRGARSSKGKRPEAEHYRYTINTVLTEYGLNGKATGARYDLPADDANRVLDALTAMDARYADLCVNLQSDAIRAVIRNYLMYLNAICCKPSGGVYFVHSARAAKLDALAELVRRVGQGCLFHQVALFDEPSQRAMLNESFQSEVEDDCRLLLRKVALVNEEANKRGTRVSPGKYAELSADYQAIVARSEEYTTILGLTQGRAAAALELALDNIIDMSTRLDFKGSR